MSLYVESMGTGPDLVLLHGWAMHGGTWGGVRERLARHFRLHLVDLPGHGFSRESDSSCRDGFADGSTSDTQTDGEPSACPLDCMVASVREVLPDESIICGWSLGGQIAIELAARHPTRVRKLVLVATTPCFIRREDWPWGTEASTLQLFGANLKRDYRPTMSRFLTLQVHGTSGDAGQVLAHLRRSVFERGEPDKTALEAGLQVLLSSDLRPAIRKIDQPVLLLHGENDVIAHPDAARWMCRELPDAQLLMLPHCGHAPFLSWPDRFADGIARLMKDG